ncbi:phage tail protein [Thiobacillus sp. 65-1402]|uniref:phage tail protein n=1 Tax=Thiobacillus sp. 65-1402 TaxID=1895861 RepID=UPI0009598BE2|nr:phage tail protein [Thiobacillus sp. 65-1402]OJW77971.1 MAG: hypothetical protein BGO62_10385 [Thiobacillus sp. 65-1402]
MLGGGSSKVVTTERVVSDRRGVVMGQDGLPQTQEGVAIPVISGTARVNPILMWLGPRRIVVTATTTSQNVGKGGGGETITQTSYSERHYQTWAVMIGKGPIRAIKRIWFNSVLVYSAEHWRDDDTKAESAKLADKIAFYPGTFDQMPDPTMQAYMGSTSTPAFRGRAYIVFNEVDISAFSNTVPHVTVEACADGHGGITEAADGPAPLHQIIGRVCRMCGLDDADIDCSQLSDNVLGHIIDSVSAGRNILDALKTAYLFDIRESAGRIEFLKRPQPAFRPEYEDRVFLNEKGLLINAYHGELGRAGLFSGSAGTSEGMTLLLQACAHAYRITGKQSWLDRALLVWQGLEEVCYRAPIPNGATLWLPHWLVNVRAPIEAQSYRMHTLLRFEPVTGGVEATIPVGPGYYSELANQVFVVFNPESFPISDLPNAEIVGDAVAVTKYPFELRKSPDGIQPSTVYLPGPTAALDAVVAYSYNAGALIDVNEPFEVDPVCRVLRDGEISCAPDAAEWAVASFDEMYLATGESRWLDARAAAVESLKQICDIDDGRSWFRPQPTTTAFSLTGTASYSKRMGMSAANWRRDPLSGNVTGFIPAATDLSRQFEAQIIRGLSGEERKAQDTHIRVEIGCSVPSVNRVWVFLRRSINFDADDTWYAPLTLTGGSALQTLDIPINLFRRYVSQGSNGAISTGEGLVSAVWQASHAYSAGNRRTSTTYNGYAYTATDGTSGATEPAWPLVIGNTVADGSVTWTCSGYAGFPVNETIRNVGISDWEASEHTLTIRRVRPIPEIPMPYTPYVTAFTVITMGGQISDWRGPPGSGYQFPDAWARSSEPTYMQGMLDFLLDAADEYATNYGARGPMMPVYVWYRADNEEYGAVNTWTWQWTDPNTMWAGYQYRPMQSIANAARRTGNATAKTLAGDFYQWLNGLWPGWPNYVITEIPEAIAPWEATTDYHTGSFNSDTSLIRPTVANGYLYRCVQTGSSGATEPATWPTTLGGQVADGTTLWECCGYAYSVTTPAFGNYHEPHFAAMIWRGALYTRMCNISAPVNSACEALMGKCHTYLSNLYNTTGEMAGTFCAYPATQDWYGFWHAEIVETLCCVKEFGSAWHTAGQLSDCDTWLDGLDAWTTSKTRTLVPLDWRDFGAGLPNGKPRPWYEIKTTQDKELPNEVSVSYSSPEQDYAKALQYSRLPGVSGSAQKANVDLPVAMAPEEANSIAFRHQYLMWGERDKFTFNVTRTLAEYEPGDTIPIPFDGVETPFRIERVDRGANGLIKIEAVPHLPDVVRYTATFAGARTASGARSMPGPVATVYEFFEAPLARDAEENPEGFLAPLTGYSGWRGADVLRSPDSGASWTTEATRRAPARLGTAYGPFGGGVSGGLIDRKTYIAVSLPQGTLESVTLDQMLAGANPAMIGDEVVHYQNAVLQGDGSYLLSVFLRGCRGTEWAIDGHVGNERFLVLDENVNRMPMPLANIGRPFDYKVVSVGEDPVDITACLYIALGRALKPYSPCHLKATRNGSGDIALTWLRRTRIGGLWRDNVDAMLSEDFEAYEIDVLSDADVVLATYTATSHTATITAAQQTALFGGLKPGMKVLIYQLSASVGRGYPLAGTV